MARKPNTPARSSQSRFNIILFAIVLIALAVWLLNGYQDNQSSAIPNDVRGTSVPLPTSVAETEIDPTATRAVRGTAIPDPTEAEPSNPDPTESPPIRGTSIPAPLFDTPAMPADIEDSAAQVVDVIDGDTLDVRLDGRVERVRLIGLNTPESVDPRRPVQCFGVEASAFTKSLVLEETIYLEYDNTQGERDQFDRLLAYVWLADGRLLNLELIGGGYAAQYTFNTPYLYRDLFRSAERAARDSEAGLWSPQTCDGDFDAPADYGSVNGDGTGCAEGCIQPPADCTIKGNVNAAGRKIYHVDGLSDAYDSVNMNPGEGDRWFCSVDEAEMAGFISAP
jgi:micrococcal nuclease